MKRKYKMRNDISEKQILFALIFVEAKYFYDVSPEMPSEVKEMNLRFELLETFFGANTFLHMSTDFLINDKHIYEWGMKEIDKFFSRQTKEDVEKCKETVRRKYRKEAI